MKANTKVEPCPFCQSKKIGLKTESTQGKHVFWLYCLDCQATGPVKESEDKAIFAWGAYKLQAGDDNDV